MDVRAFYATHIARFAAFRCLFCVCLLFFLRVFFVWHLQNIVYSLDTNCSFGGKSMRKKRNGKTVWFGHSCLLHNTYCAVYGFSLPFRANFSILFRVFIVRSLVKKVEKLVSFSLLFVCIFVYYVFCLFLITKRIWRLTAFFFGGIISLKALCQTVPQREKNHVQVRTSLPHGKH